MSFLYPLLGTTGSFLVHHVLKPGVASAVRTGVNKVLYPRKVYKVDKHNRQRKWHKVYTKGSRITHYINDV